MAALTSPAAEQGFRFRPRSAPLPPPAELGEYERLVPGTSERLILLAERSDERRAELEGEYLRLVARTQRLRLVLIGLVACSVLLTGVTFGVAAVYRPQSAPSVLLAMVLPMASGLLAGFVGGGVKDLARGRGPFAAVGRPAVDDTADQGGRPGATA